MESSISLYKRDEISDFLLDKFDINIDNYSDEELNNLIIKINELLDERIKIEEKKYLDLKKELENKNMILDSFIDND